MNLMKSRISKNAMLGLVLIGLLLCGSARSAINLLDGGTNTITTVTNGAGSTIQNTNFTVSQGASVLVVELWDRNTETNHSSPSFMTWSNATTGTAQTLIRAVSEVSGASTYSDCDIYYLFNPTPGDGSVSGTDTNAVTIQGLTMEALTLSGVDTTITPAIYATNGGSVTTLSVTTSNSTPSGAWAAVISYDGNTGNALNNASTTGVSTYLDVENNQEQAVGYVSALTAGSSTISMTDSAGSSKATLAVAVFSPAIGTGIHLLDGSIFSTNATTISGPATITNAFTVTQGASVMVVELYDNNNDTAAPGPTALVWSNTTLGTTQLLTLCEATNTTAYTWTWADLYYLWDPAPGVGVVTGTDTNSQESSMFMQVFTLSGVDTTVLPFAAGNGNGNASTLSVDTETNTVFGSWAAVMSVNYNGGGGNNVTIKAGSGGAVEDNFRPDGLQCTMGYITNLAAGAATITANATGGATHMDMAAEVFAPLPGTATPTNVVATAQTARVALSWNDASGGIATGYVVLRSTNSTSGFAAIATNTGNATTTYTDTGVADWTTYYYVVEAVGPSGVSLSSLEVSATPVGLPAVPAGVTATAGVNQVTLTWNTQLGATNFNVLRSTTSGSGFAAIGGSPTNSFTDTNVIDGTLYFYEVNAVNNFGNSANSSQASAVPVVAFFTNYIGVFNTSADTTGWVTLNGTADAQFLTPGPASGPSAGSLVLDATYGPGGTDAFQGIATNFPVAINVSTYPNLEMDIINEAAYDEYGQIQAIQINLQVPTNGTLNYEQGTSGSLTLYETATGSTWTHYVYPMSDWAGYDLAAVSAFAINIYDGDTTAATELDPAFANIKFSGAPAWAPTFTDLTSPTIGTNATNVTLTGTVRAIVAGTNVYLASNTVVTVTINGETETGAIVDATGDFSVDFPTTGLKVGANPVTYTATSDLVALIGATNDSTSLTISSVALPPAPTILAPSLDSTGANVVIRVATVTGRNYNLLSATNLAPPVVWSTVSATAGTGGTITNLVPIIKNEPGLFLKYQVQ
jgi:hypothetical protein